jgi:hypothetical protein
MPEPTPAEAALAALVELDVYPPDGVPILDKHLKKARAEGFRAGLEEAARIADQWADSVSCTNHDDDPCCHVRTGIGIADAIRRRRRAQEPA